MRAEIIVVIVRAILCEKNLRAWLENQAKLSDNPLDNIALKIIYQILGCDKEE